MAEIKITIPDNRVAEVLTAFDSIYTGRGQISQAQWAKSKMINFVQAILRDYRQQEAQKQADKTEITIT